MCNFRFVGHLSCVAYCDLSDESIVNVSVSVANISPKHVHYNTLNKAVKQNGRFYQGHYDQSIYEL